MTSSLVSSSFPYPINLEYLCATCSSILLFMSRHLLHSYIIFHTVHPSFIWSSLPYIAIISTLYVFKILSTFPPEQVHIMTTDYIPLNFSCTCIVGIVTMQIDKLTLHRSFHIVKLRTGRNPSKIWHQSKV